MVANGVSILIRSWSPNLYLPRTFSIRREPFCENSQTVAFEPPDMRHLPTIVDFPQPAIADTKTARMMIRNQALRRAEVNGMTTGISCCVAMITTVNNLASHFDAKKPVCFREADYVPTDYKPRRACSARVPLCGEESTRYSSLSALGLLAFFPRLPSAMRRVLKSDKRPFEIKPQQESVWICMCGLSKNQPFCDGSHKTTRDEEDGKTYDYDSEGHRHEV